MPVHDSRPAGAAAALGRRAPTVANRATVGRPPTGALSVPRDAAPTPVLARLQPIGRLALRVQFAAAMTLTRAAAIALVPALLAAACKGSVAGGGAADASSGQSGDGSAGDGDGGPSSGPLNVIFILTDDQRADTLSCMPKLRQRAYARGLEFDRSYATTSLCCPSRSTILTGQYSHNHGVLNNGGEIDDEQFGGAGLFRALGNEEETFAKWLKADGYRTGFFGKFMNGYAELAGTSGDAYVPPYWDVWMSPLDTEHIFYYFILVQKLLGEGDAERVCYLPKNDFNGDQRQRCRDRSDRVIDDGRANYSETIVAEKAADFIRQAARDQVPFFAHISFKAPHSPYISSPKYQPDPTRYQYTAEALSALESCPLWDWNDRPSTYLDDNQVSIDKQPLWIRGRREAWAAGGLDASMSAGRLREKRQGQLASLLAIDDEVDRLFALLDETRLADRTVVIFTGDNGYTWGEHYWDAKNCSLETCSRVPLVAFHPARTSHTISGWLSANIDHAPTIMELAGVPIPGGALVNGLSYKAALDGSGEPAERDAILLECNSGSFQRSKGGPDFHGAVVSADQWKYVEHFRNAEMTEMRTRPDGDPDVDLYDLSRDPHEAVNLSHLSDERLIGLGYDPAELDARRAELRARLRALEAE
jgi:N-acetylglucosamine-6-sulfatase